MHKELAELALLNKVSKADPRCLSDGIMSLLPGLMKLQVSSHEIMFQSGKRSEPEMIEHVSGKDSGLQIVNDAKLNIDGSSKEERSRLAAENQALKNELSALRQMMANQTKSYEEKLKECEERQLELAKAEADNTSQIEKKDLLIFDLRDEISGLKNSKKELEMKVQKLEFDTQSMEISHNSVINAIEENYKDERKEHEDEVEDLKKIIKEGEEMTAKQDIQIKTLQEELQQMNDESKALKESNKIAMEELKNMIIKAEDKFSKAYDDFVEERKSKQTICLKFASEKEELEKQIAILQDENSDLNKDMTCKKEKLEKAKQYKDNVENTIELFQVKIQQQEEKIEELEKRLHRRRGFRKFLTCSG